MYQMRPDSGQRPRLVTMYDTARSPAAIEGCTRCCSVRYGPASSNAVLQPERPRPGARRLRPLTFSCMARCRCEVPPPRGARSVLDRCGWHLGPERQSDCRRRRGFAGPLSGTALRGAGAAHCASDQACGHPSNGRGELLRATRSWCYCARWCCGAVTGNLLRDTDLHREWFAGIVG